MCNFSPTDQDKSDVKTLLKRKTILIDVTLTNFKPSENVTAVVLLALSIVTIPVRKGKVMW